MEIATERKQTLKPLTLNRAGVTSHVTETEQLQIMAIVACQPHIPPSLWALRDFDKLLSDISEICLCFEICRITFDLTKGPIPLALSVLASTYASFKSNSLVPLHKQCRSTAYCPAQISRSKIQSRSGQSQCRNSPVGPVHFAGRELIWVDMCSQLDTCHFCKSAVATSKLSIWLNRWSAHTSLSLWCGFCICRCMSGGLEMQCRRKRSGYIYTCLGPVNSAILLETCNCTKYLMQMSNRSLPGTTLFGGYSYM